MKESELIKHWLAVLDKESKANQMTEISRKEGNNYALVTHQYTLSDGEIKTFTTSWSHGLFISARKSIEDDNWFFLSAYHAENLFFLKMQYRDDLSLVYECVFLNDVKGVIYVRPGFYLKVNLVKEDTLGRKKIIDKDVKKENNHLFLEKRKEFTEFFQSWLEKESKYRLSFLLKDEKINLIS